MRSTRVLGSKWKLTRLQISFGRGLKGAPKAEGDVLGERAHRRPLKTPTLPNKNRWKREGKRHSSRPQEAWPREERGATGAVAPSTAKGMDKGWGTDGEMGGLLERRRNLAL